MELELSANRFDLDTFLGLGPDEESISTNDERIFDYLCKRWIMLGAKTDNPKYDEIHTKFCHIQSRRVIGKGELSLSISDNPILDVKIRNDQFWGEVYHIQRGDEFREIIWENDIPRCVMTSIKLPAIMESGEGILTPYPVLFIGKCSALRKSLKIRQSHFNSRIKVRDKAEEPILLNIVADRLPMHVPANSVIHITLDLREYYISQVLMDGNLSALKSILLNQAQDYLSQLKEKMKQDLLNYKERIKNYSEEDRNRMVDTFLKSKNMSIIRERKKKEKEIRDKLNQFREDRKTLGFEAHKRYNDAEIQFDIDKIFHRMRELKDDGCIVSIIIELSEYCHVNSKGEIFRRDSERYFEKQDQFIMGAMERYPHVLVFENPFDYELKCCDNSIVEPIKLDKN